MSSSEDERPRFSQGKKQNTYGVFAQDMKEDSDEEPQNKKKLTQKNFLNFKKSGDILHDVNKKVNVKMAVNLEKKMKKVTFDEQQFSESSQSSIEVGQDVSERVISFQRQEIKIDKKVKISGIMNTEQTREKNMEQQYGSALKMMKNMGFDINKGLGKNKQGRVDPVQAIEKKSMSSNYEIQVKNIGINKPKIIQSLPQQAKPQQGEEMDSCVVTRRWDKKPQYQRNIEIVQQQEDKIIDLRGHNKSVQLNQVQSFLLKLKQNWNKEKNKYFLLIERQKEIENNNQQLIQEKNQNSLKLQQITQQKNTLKIFLLTIQEIKQQKDIIQMIYQVLKCYQLSKQLFEKYKLQDLLIFQVQKLLQKIQINQLDDYILKQIFLALKTIFPEINNANLDNLQYKDNFQDSKAQQYFNLILESSIFQKLSLMCQNDIQGVLDFLEKNHSISNVFLDKFGEQQLLPKLIVIIQNHNLKEPLHCKVNPFLPFLQENQREQLIDNIHIFLLNNIPKLNILELNINIIPFQQIIDPFKWKNLCLRLIIPKLLFILNKIEVDPSNQAIDELEQVFLWLPAFEENQIRILFQNFFQKLIKIANQWKEQKGDINEMKIWIEGWMDFVPQKIKDTFIQIFNQITQIIQ